VEKEREASEIESEEKDRSGEAYLRLPFGIALSIDEAVSGDCIAPDRSICFRRAAVGTEAINSGMTGLSGCVCMTASSSCTRLVAAACCLCGAAFFPAPLQGACNAVDNEGHSSVVAAAIC